MEKKRSSDEPSHGRCLCVLLGACCLMMVSMPGNVLADEVEIISSVARAAENTLRYFGESHVNGETGRWQEFDSEALLQQAQVTGEVMSTATLDSSREGMVARVTFRSPSGDWSNHCMYEFGPDNVLGRIIALLRTFHGNVRVSRVYARQSGGDMKELAKAVRDLQTGEFLDDASSTSFMDVECPVYSKVFMLPFLSAPAGQATVRALSPEEVERIVKPHLRAGEMLAHQVFRAPLGPSADTVLVLADNGGKATAFALVPQDGGWARIDMPSLSEGHLDSVAAVFFADADHRPGPEAVVMTRQLTGAGPQGAIPRSFNAILAWNGSEFVRLARVEEKIFGMDTAAQIKEALRAAAPRRSASRDSSALPSKVASLPNEHFTSAPEQDWVDGLMLEYALFASACANDQFAMLLARSEGELPHDVDGHHLEKPLSIDCQAGPYGVALTTRVIPPRPHHERCHDLNRVSVLVEVNGRTIIDSELANHCTERGITAVSIAVDSLKVCGYGESGEPACVDHRPLSGFLGRGVVITSGPTALENRAHSR